MAASKPSKVVGAVYVMDNNLQDNSIIAYNRFSDGTLTPMASFATGGKGGILDNFDDIDPLFSAFSLIVSRNLRYVLAVNAGSRSVSLFTICPDFSLRLTSVREVSGFGPLSVAYARDLVYVASYDAGTEQPPTLFGSKGSLTGFRVTRHGKLETLPGSVRKLNNRPAAVKFSPDACSLVVSSFAAGSAELDTTAVEEFVSYKVLDDGLLSSEPVSIVTSTKRNDPAGRNLPAAIGFDIAKLKDIQYVVAGEARTFTPQGEPLVDQTSSISVWKLTSESKLLPLQLDVLLGPSVTDGERTTCWVEFSKIQNVFWVANTVSGTISAFSFRGGKAVLVDRAAGRAPVPIDLWRSADGKFLYQLSNGAVDAFEIEDEGRGTGLKKIQTVTDIPPVNVQGIAAI